MDIFCVPADVDRRTVNRNRQLNCVSFQKLSKSTISQRVSPFPFPLLRNGRQKKAFFYSFASGLSEPVGALIGYLILTPFMSDVVYGILFAAVAGIMVFISVDELLPSARAYGEHHLSIYGLMTGMVVMAISLWLFM